MQVRVMSVQYPVYEYQRPLNLEEFSQFWISLFGLLKGYNRRVAGISLMAHVFQLAWSSPPVLPDLKHVPRRASN